MWDICPTQPVPYSHALHVGQLGMDCRYCHTGVEVAAAATIPPTQTCMNCHSKVRANSEKLIPIRESYATGMPVPWIRVHDLPDYVYFDHSAHVRRGVGCVSCHGRIDTMEVVFQAEPLSMGWCLECHRNPGAAPAPGGVRHPTRLGGRGGPAGARLEVARNQQHQPTDGLQHMSSLKPEQSMQYWRSLDELAQTPEFKEAVRREFPNDEWDRLAAGHPSSVPQGHGGVHRLCRIDLVPVAEGGDRSLRQPPRRPDARRSRAATPPPWRSAGRRSVCW